MLNFNLSLVEFTFDGNQTIIANVPNNHDFKLSIGPAKIQLFSHVLLPADITELTPIDGNPDFTAVKMNFSMPIVF